MAADQWKLQPELAIAKPFLQIFNGLPYSDNEGKCNK